MREPAKASQDFRVLAISGTHTILLALDCPETRRKGLKGFAFAREVVGPGSTGPKYLQSQKVFNSIVPDPKNARDPHDASKPRRFYTNEFPIQSFRGTTVKRNRRVMFFEEPKSTGFDNAVAAPIKKHKP
jgi:hypothetical protein